MMQKLLKNIGISVAFRKMTRLVTSNLYLLTKA